MMTNVTKRKYSKPSAKVVEWDFNESVCSSVVTYSSGRCLDVQRGNQQSTGDREGGYYSSGDSDLFEQGSEDANKYLPLTNRNYNYSPDIMLQGFGYYTRTGNQLFTPVTGGEAHVYIRIKHWTGSGEPTDEWLLDDTGALQTEVDMGGTTVPANNSFHIYGLLMDIRQFQSAWESAGGDAAANATRSTGGVRTFTLKDAKVVCETF